MVAKKKKTSSLQEDIAHMETRVDSTMDDIATKLDGKVSKQTKDQAKNFMEKADAVADEVDTFVGKVDDLAASVFPHSGGTEAHFDAVWSEHISRLFIFRFLWMIIQYFIILVWGIWISILSIVHWLYMLVFGKRERNIWDRQVRFFNHIIKWKAYICGLTDQRPDLITPAKK